ncbi:ParA family protein [Rubrimonas cliftonensis]|uniref:Plasmid segregation oscillating ATPase ParF n=1 Tax=Rubrimonas cliftonensis TaxID=89524 RepID=A0A1H4EI54_9RHOB|nr:ParA family protein [Rubrimonas cliftonensis]SEA84764.1 plasmid segregation oscillating ATPase ParF [Rubrimonas cliftonensis]
MSGRVIVFAQQKGGAGKTTLLTQCAAAWMQEGRRVAAVDLDPQRSLTGWVDARARAGVQDVTLFESSEWRAGTDIRRAGAEADLVLVDCPGAVDVLQRAVMRDADLVVAPAQPSAPDAWATRATLRMAEREGARALVALNRVPPRGGPGAEIEAMLKADGAEIMESRVGARIAFAQAFLEGRGVTEGARAGRAADEVRALAAEILAELEREPPRRR